MDEYKKIFQDKLNSCFRNKNILVTGGTGSIGSEIVRQLLNYAPKQIRIYSRGEYKQFCLQEEFDNNNKNAKKILRFLIGDIRDKERLNRAFNNIDIVFHAAALKHVPFCEMNPFEAIKTNIQGTQNVLDLAIDNQVEKVIAISSDKAVNPNTVMGITKLMMERMVVSAPNYSGEPKIKFGVVRFGNVVNSRGSVIPLWIDQIKKGKPITITDPRMTRYFMSIHDAVKLVFMAVTLFFGSEIFVLKMPKYNINDLAMEVIKRFSNGNKHKINIIGAREREKRDEKLFTDEEEALMHDVGPFHVIQPDKISFLNRKLKYKKIVNCKIKEDIDVLSSLVGT